jgi:hypothetical protein
MKGVESSRGVLGRSAYFITKYGFNCNTDFWGPASISSTTSRPQVDGHGPVPMVGSEVCDIIQEARHKHAL